MSTVVRFVIAPLVLIGFVALGVQISRQAKREQPRSGVGVVIQKMAQAVHVYVGLAAIGVLVVLLIGLVRLVL